MNYIYEFFNNIFIIASAMSFYILIGLVVAGVMKQLISDDFVSKHLGDNSLMSVIKATILGIPLPVCSCSVIPLAKGLQKEGASPGAVQSFLISAPITGADSIAATYSFFGWFFTLYRLITSMIIAISVGIIENYFSKKDRVVTIDTTELTNCCSSGGCCDSKSKDSKFAISKVFSYAFNTLFADIAKSLLWGLVIGALFLTFLPKSLLQELYSHTILTYFLVLIMAMPLYVCATSSLPIAAAFIVGGMSTGGAFIFLSAGPATNSVTMGVVASMFGKRSLLIYLGVISILSILFGYILDNYFSDLKVIKIVEHIEELSYIDIMSTVLMFMMIFYYILRRR